MVHKTSNPGIVTQSFGGVARNVCEALHRLNTDCILISAVSDDVFGDMIKSHLSNELKVSTEGIVTIPGKRSAVYSSMHDEKGELLAAVADMDILEASIAVEHFNKHTDNIQGSGIVFLDGNISSDVMRAICTAAHAKRLTVFHDPTSVAKCSKAIDSGCLHLIDWLKPDESEMWEMAQSYISKNMDTSRVLSDIADCIAVLVEHAGVGNVLVTRGPAGVLHGYISPETRRLQIDEYDALPVEQVQSVTGAGDSFCAGVIYGLVSRQPVQQCIRYGLRASQLALMTSKAINPELNSDSIISLV